MGASRRRRVLFIGELITLSHMARPATLAKTLDPAQYDVVFACDHRHISLLDHDHHMKLVPLTSRMADKSMEAMAIGAEPFYDYEMLEQYIHEDLALFDAYAPDVVVGDMRQSLLISSRLRKIPFVNIQNSYWHPDSDTFYDSPVSPWTHLLGEPWGRWLYNGVVNACLPFTLLPVHMACIRYGLPIVGLDFKDILSYGDFTVFPDIPELSPLDHVPEHTAYVGSCIWSPMSPEPEWWHALPEHQPIIYVSLGSSGQPRLLTTILQALARIPATLIVSTSSRAAITSLSEHVYVADYLNGLEAARRARVVICNGGSTAAHQSLAAGTPVLGIASNMDQTASMRGIVARNAGEMILEMQLTEDTVHDAVWRLMSSPMYHQAARALSQIINHFDTAQAFNAVMDQIFAGLPSTYAPR